MYHTHVPYTYTALVSRCHITSHVTHRMCVVSSATCLVSRQVCVLPRLVLLSSCVACGVPRVSSGVVCLMSCLSSGQSGVSFRLSRCFCLV